MHLFLEEEIHPQALGRRSIYVFSSQVPVRNLVQ